MELLANMAKDKLGNILNLEDNLTKAETKLKRLSCRWADFKQQVTKAEQTGKRKRKREVEHWFKEVEQMEDEFKALKTKIQDRGLVKNISSGDSVAKLDAKLEQLLEQSQSQHFEDLLVDDHDNRGEPRMTTKLFGDKFHKGLEIIWNWLVTDSLSNIGIYGQGGVGKTTLAKHIHNHLLEKTDFNVYWVTVSQEFSIKKLQDDIAKRVNLDLSCEDDEDLRAAMLSRSLVQQQSVLILDDVWEEFCPNNIGIALGANKCRLILTTRSLQLCHRMHCQRKFDVKTLDTDEAWNLFKYTLELETVLTPEVEEIAKKVARRCGGLPLGIITAAGSMRGMIDIYEWRIALEQLKSSSIGYKEMENKVFPVLEWSFNRLNECERLCFLYCCLYPEDWNIERVELIDLFVLAEVIPRRNNRELEDDHARAILNKLIKACMLEETQDSNGRECVKMHDLIRDMALRITHRKSTREIKGDVPRFLVKSIEARSNVIVVQNEWTEDLNAVSFVGTYSTVDLGRIQIPRGMSPNCQNLSTLLLQDVRIERIPDSFFGHMDRLKILSLRDCSCLKELPNCISNMVNLTALLLQRCWELRSVPPLGKLKQLRELDLSNTKIDDIPQGLELLFKLERLNMGRTRLKKKTIPKGTFSRLRHLQQLVLPTCINVCDLQVLKQLQVFRGRLTLMEVYNELMTSVRWPKHYNISIVEETPPSNDFADFDFETNDRNKLDFEMCKFQRGLNVVLIPEDIQELILNKCFSLTDVNLQNLIHRSKGLVYLEIIHSEEVKFLFDLSSPPHVDDDELVLLPNLQRLLLMDLPNFMGLINSGLSSSSSSPSSSSGEELMPLSCLTHLTISECHKLKKLFTVQLLQHSLKNLQYLDVSHCEQLEEIVANDQEVGEEIASHPSSSTLQLPKLCKLSLLNLPRLEFEFENKCKAIIIIISDSIHEISVLNCPKLKRLPLFIPINNTTNGQTCAPKTLQRIRGSKEWWESLEWDHNPNAKDVLQPFFHSINYRIGL